MNSSLVFMLGLSLVFAWPSAAGTLGAGDCPAFVVTVFSPDELPAPPDLDAVVGIEGLTIERFEDVSLVLGLTYLGPISGSELATLPNLFSRDSFSGSFFWTNDPWDGDHVLSNYASNVAASSLDLGPLELRFSGGAERVGLGLSNLQFSGATWDINDVDMGSLNTLPNLVGGLGQNGYIRVDRTPGCEPIASIRFRPVAGDSVTIDHVAFGVAVIETTFVDIEDQLDDQGVVDPDTQQTVFTVVDGIGQPVANVSGALASFVGIATEDKLSFLRLGSSQGVPDDDGVLLVAELPGFFPGEETLLDRTLRITAREATAASARAAVGDVEEVCVRPRLTDASGDQGELVECATVGPDFAESSFLVRTRNVRTIGGADSVDLSRVVGLSITVETNGSVTAVVGATEVQIDSVVRVPEPAPAILGASALLALSVLGGRRGARRPSCTRVA